MEVKLEMKRFCVEIKGHNLLFNIDGDHQLFSMDAISFVRAPDSQVAGKTALARLMLAPAVKERLVDEGQRQASYALHNVTELGWFEFFCKKRTERLEFQVMDAVDGTRP
jgi:hypothetical protein